MERWRAWIQRGAYAAALLITVTAALLWLTSYARNEMYVRAVEKQRQEVNRQIQALSPDQTDPAATLPLLDAARAIPGGYADRDAGKPWLMGFGLYQGDKLGGEAKAIYQRLLLQVMLPRIVLRLEERLRQNAGNPGYLYDTLKIYLMMDDPERFDAKAVKGWMEQEWQLNLPRTVGREQRDHLSAHLDALLEQAPLKSPIALDSGLIQNSRAVLNQVPLSQRIYERIKQNQRSAGAPPDIGLTLAAGPDTPRVFDRKSGQPLNSGVPGLYTYKGYYQFFLRREPESWSVTWPTKAGFWERRSRSPTTRRSGSKSRTTCAGCIWATTCGSGRSCWPTSSSRALTVRTPRSTSCRCYPNQPRPCAR